MDQSTFTNRPVLIADLADAEAAALLREVASRAGVAIVPLLVAPVDRSEHLLEAYAPGSSEPIRLVAEPVGSPLECGFPLRLRELEAARQPAIERASDERPIVRGTQPQLGAVISERHTRDLEPVDAQEDNPDALVGRTLGGRFLLEACLGRGGMGAVFRARHTAIGLPVAIKILKSSLQRDPAFAARFHAEALAMSRLNHANIARILDYGQEPDGLLFLAMELVEGQTLQDMLDAGAKFDSERVAGIMAQVAAGLGHAHAQGIVHRDVKPSNVLLAEIRDDDDRTHEVAKVCDFGIAIEAIDEESAFALVGTPEYMSPEQTRGQAVDARSDVYALGVVLYELVTGSLPFSDPRPERVFGMHRAAKPVPPSTAVPTLDPRLEAIVLKALAKLPAERHQTMRELRDELRALLAESPSRRPLAAAPERSGGGGWLEDSRQMYETFMMTAAEEPPEPPGVLTARALVMNADGWLAMFTAITDPDVAAREARGLEAALDVLVEQDATSVLARIVMALRARAGDALPGLDTCEAIAARTLRAMEDPARLGAIARHALDGEGEIDPDTLRLFVETRAAAAHALVAARTTRDTPSARTRFIAAMRAVREPALPVILAELKRALEKGALGSADTEDLLRAIPPVADEGAGTVVAAFLRSPRPEVAAAALAATVRLWGHRARPLLLGAADGTHSSVRTVAVCGLRALGAVDAHAVRVLARVLTDNAANVAARTAAAEALGVSQPEARSAAGIVLERVLAETVAGVSIADDPSAQTYVLALARSLLAVGGPSGAGLVRRCAGATELTQALRDRLQTLLRAAPAG